jgi:hypothetical protein
MMPISTVEHYGNKLKSFIGTIVNTNDPLQLGRVQVRIYGTHSDNTDDIPNHSLPWADTCVPITEGGISGIGTNIGVKEFAQVYGMFLDGENSQVPLVLGSIPKYERDDEKDFSKQQSAHDIDLPLLKPEQLKVFLVGTTNTEIAWNWFKATYGGEYSNIATAGILGNLWVESFAVINNNDLNPLAKQKGGPGRGLAQWEIGSSRYNELIKRSSGLPGGIDGMYAQLSFITYELDKYSYYGKTRLIEARTPELAAEVFMESYERPKQTLPRLKPVELGGAPHPTGYEGLRLERRNAARDIYDNFTTL